MVDVKYIASCSWGKDSTAMVLKLIAYGCPLDEVIFYDTGMEFDCIYNVRDLVLPLLKNRSIQYTELKPENDFYLICWLDPKSREKQKKEHMAANGVENVGGTLL